MMRGYIKLTQKLIIVFCILTLPACHPGGRQNLEPASPSVGDPGTTNLGSTVPSALATTSDDGSVTPLGYVIGRNDYIVDVDDTPREFIIHVPNGYDPALPTPVVMIFHGTNQNGESMYKKTAWVDQAELETILVVFPSSWEYFITGENRMEEKWNALNLEQLTPPGTQLKDDVHFVEVILSNLKATFNVDEKRIFASGGSNGGGFVMTRLAVEMNDEFAAFSTCGAVMLGEDDPSVLTGTVLVSLYNVLGSADEKIAETNGLTLPFPFTAQEIVDDPSFNRMLVTTTTYLGLEMSYTVQSEPDFTTFTFDQSLIGADNEYIFRMVRGTGHIYPSGDNNRARLDVSKLFWEFFIRHSKP